MKQLEIDILGAMVLSKDIAIDAEMRLREKYFETFAAKQLFRIILELWALEIQPDVVSIYNAVLQKELDKKIKIEEITKVTDVLITSNYAYNSALLIENYLRKLLQEKAKKIDFENKAQDIFEIYENYINELNLTLNEVSTEELPTAKQLLEEVITEMELEREGEIEPAIYSKQFPSLNYIDGLRKGNMMTISGQQKAGKSTFGIALIVDFAIRQGKKAAIISLEMTRKEVMQKMIAQATRTRYGYLRNPAKKNKHGKFKYSDERFLETKEKAARELSTEDVYIFDNLMQESEIRAKIKFLVERKGVEIIMIDYIGLIQTSVRRERRDLEVAALSRGFKTLAQKLNCIMIILSQENTEKKIAESKALARDSDFWISISRPIDESNKEYEKFINRHGVEQEVKIDNSLFKVLIRASRHSAAGGKFYTYLMPYGEMVELDTEHQLELQEPQKEETPI